MKSVNHKQAKDISLLATFVEIYCHRKHPGTELTDLELPTVDKTVRLCPECVDFLQYGISRRLNCPLEAKKPTCKNCRIHCYGSEQRKKVRKIMVYAGRHLMMRGRLDYLWHYFF